MEDRDTGTKATLDAQIVVIGASLAGCACAIELAQSGISVALIERKSTPARKPCGEGLSHLAAPHLEHLGLSLESLRSEPRELRGYRFASPLGLRTGCHNLRVTTTDTRAWGVSRSDLNGALLARLSALDSAKLISGCTVRHIIRKDSSWNLHIESGEIAAHFVVIATGSHPRALARSFIQCSTRPSKRVALTAIGEYRSGKPHSEVVIIPHKEGEIYVTPLGISEVNVSVVGTPRFVQHYRELNRLKESVQTAIGLEVSLVTQPLGSGHFGTRQRSLDPLLYLAGDAFESFDPACGLGMTHALASGIATAQAIRSVLLGGASEQAAHAKYQAKHHQAARSVRIYSAVIRSLIGAFRRFPRATTLVGQSLGPQSLKILDLLAPNFESCGVS